MGLLIGRPGSQYHIPGQVTDARLDSKPVFDADGKLLYTEYQYRATVVCDERQADNRPGPYPAHQPESPDAVIKKSLLDATRAIENATRELAGEPPHAEGGDDGVSVCQVVYAPRSEG